MKRMLGLSGALTILFVVFHALFGQVEPTQAQMQATPFELLKFPLGAGVFAGCLGAIWMLRKAKALQPNNEGVVLLQQGRILEAIEKFQDSRDRPSDAIPCLNIGVASLSLWRIPEAISALEEFEKRAKGTFGGVRPELSAQAASSLALAYALSGSEAGSRGATQDGTDNARGPPDRPRTTVVFEVTYEVFI